MDAYALCKWATRAALLLELVFHSSRIYGLWNCQFHNLENNEDDKYVHSRGLAGLLTCPLGLY